MTDKVDAAREALLHYRSRSLEAALTYRDLIDDFEAAIRAESEATVAALRAALVTLSRDSRDAVSRDFARAALAATRKEAER